MPPWAWMASVSRRRPFDEVIGSDAHAGPVAFARVVHAGGFEHVEPHAAVGALGVVGDEALADFAVDPRSSA